jgi:hypothetical protein
VVLEDNGFAKRLKIAHLETTAQVKGNIGVSGNEVMFFQEMVKGISVVRRGNTVQDFGMNLRVRKGIKIFQEIRGVGEIRRGGYGGRTS